MLGKDILRPSIVLDLSKEEYMGNLLVKFAQKKNAVEIKTTKSVSQW